VWIVDIEGDVVELHREPAGSEYRVQQRYIRGDVLRPALLPDIEIPVSAILD
jgi:Uma2 family endonuclease